MHYTYYTCAHIHQICMHICWMCAHIPCMHTCILHMCTRIRYAYQKVYVCTHAYIHIVNTWCLNSSDVTLAAPFLTQVLLLNGNKSCPSNSLVYVHEIRIESLLRHNLFHWTYEQDWKPAHFISPWNAA